MLRSLVRFGAALACAVLVAPGASPSAAPAPGLAYDELVRVLVGATPPPPGGFQADLAALNASPAPNPSAAPKRRGIGLGALAGAVLGGGGAGSIGSAIAGDVVSTAAENALSQQLSGTFAGLASAMRSFLSPHLFHYAYWNGWERVDDVTAQTATIRKCDIGRVVRLDLAKKTYHIDVPADDTPAPAAPAPAAPRSRPERSEPAPPGTAVAELTSTTRALGPLRIDNQPTVGYAATTTFAMTQSTGSCRDGRTSLEATNYYTGLTPPAVTACPVRRPPVPLTPSDAVAPPPRGGCRPTFSASRNGPAEPSGKLPAYTLLTMSAAVGAASPAPASTGTGRVGFLTERGNFATLGAPNSDQFEIPAGFTQQP